MLLLPIPIPTYLSTYQATKVVSELVHTYNIQEHTPLWLDTRNHSTPRQVRAVGGSGEGVPSLYLWLWKIYKPGTTRTSFVAIKSDDTTNTSTIDDLYDAVV